MSESKASRFGAHDLILILFCVCASLYENKREKNEKKRNKRKQARKKERKKKRKIPGIRCA